MAAPIIDAILDRIVEILDSVPTLRATRTAPATDDPQDGTVVVRLASDSPEAEAEGETQAATQRSATVTLMIVAKVDPSTRTPIDKRLLQHWADAVNALNSQRASIVSLGAISLWASDYQVFVEDDLSLGEIDASIRILYAHDGADPTVKAYV